MKQSNQNKKSYSAEGLEEALKSFYKLLSEESIKENNLDLMKKEMKSLLNYLCKDTNEFKNSVFLNDLNDYLLKYKRLLYSEISVFMYSISDDTDGKKLNLIENINNALAETLIHDADIENNTTRIIIKLWDHVNLATKQYENLKTSDEAFRKRIDPYVQELNEKNEAWKKTKEELDETKKEIFTQLISIVSIFVAIAFVMFGGISLINGLLDFSEMPYIPMIELVCLGSLIGIVMISVVYAFIIFALRLTTREFGGKSPFRKTYVLSITTLTVIFLFTFSIWLIDYSKYSNIIPPWFPFFFLLVSVFVLLYMVYTNIRNK